MRMAVKKSNHVSIKTVESPSPADGQIRVKVEACGVCGTDMWVSDEEASFGHEIAGLVDAVGTGVTRVAVGDRIVLDSATPCGACDNCRNAKQELCTDIQSFFFIESFGMADAMIAPAISAIPFAGIAPEVACLQEPLGVALDVFRLADITLDSNVLVLGAGPIGLMAVSLATRAGARRVFAADLGTRPRRLELAREWGANDVLDPSQIPLPDFDFGCEIDRVIVTAPPRTLPDAMRVAAKGGIITFIGIEHGEGAQCTFDANEFHFKKLQLRASFASPALLGATAVRMLSEGIIDGEALISHRFPLEQITEALDTARTDPTALKVVVTS